ncbi:MAG TPA: hypothetical protein VHU61_15115 [Solirubrobacteraceae bacterium]|jgi:hypothetical protein|nr:hypothetical protein [Solirubrobacteraceae bacterium]
MTASARDEQSGLEPGRDAEDLRASAAEHRARAHELRASVNGTDEFGQADGDAYLHAGIEERLASVANLRAEALDQRARGDTARAEQLEREADALGEVGDGDGELHDALSQAALERARVRERLRLAGAARRAAIARGDSSAGALHRARAESHEAWAELHARLALAHQLRARGLGELAETSLHEAETLRSAARQAEQRLPAAGRQAGAESPAEAVPPGDAGPSPAGEPA